MVSSHSTVDINTKTITNCNGFSTEKNNFKKHRDLKT